MVAESEDKVKIALERGSFFLDDTGGEITLDSPEVEAQREMLYEEKGKTRDESRQEANKSQPQQVDEQQETSKTDEEPDPDAWQKQQNAIHALQGRLNTARERLKAARKEATTLHLNLLSMDQNMDVVDKQLRTLRSLYGVDTESRGRMRSSYSSSEFMYDVHTPYSSGDEESAQ